MELEEYCEKNGYGISEVRRGFYDLSEEFILGLINKKDKIYPETEIRKRLEVEKIIKPTKTGKKIVFAEDWNRQCHLSSLFLEGEFYFAIDGHSDLIKKDPWEPKVYHCGDYRNLILEWLEKNNGKMFLITTENLEEMKRFRYEDKDEEYFEHERLFNSFSLENLKEKTTERIKNKKGILCLDYDILSPQEIEKHKLDDMYNKWCGIETEKLGEIIKTILSNSDIRTFFITVPYIRKDFLEALLQ